MKDAPLLPTSPVFRRALVRSAALPFVLLTALGLAVLAEVQGLLAARGWVDHTNAVIGEVTDVRAALLDLEARARAFYLHGEDDVLAPESSLASLRTRAAALPALVADNPRQVARARELALSIDDYARYHRSALRLAREAGDVEDLVREEGHAALSRLREVTETMISVEEGLRATRAAAADGRARRARVVTLGAALGLGVLLGGVTSLQVTRLAGVYRRAIDALEARAQSLAESEQRFRHLVDAVRDYAIFVVDPAGTIVSWNPGAERATGWRADEVVGRPLSVLYVDQEGAAAALARELAAAAGPGGYAAEAPRRRKDGSTFWALVSLAALRDEDGRLTGFVKVTRDVTEQRRVAEELERRVDERTAALQEANEGLEAFGYTVSHDLRAPLRALHGFAAALLEDCQALSPECAGYARHIVQAAERMEALIGDLLAYARLARERPPTQPVDLGSVVAEALEPLAPEVARRGARVEVRGELGAALAHRPTLVQVVQNLLSNALKFARPGAAPRVRVRAERRDGRRRLWVEDEGIGVSLADQARIFEAFERLHGDDEFPGTGIGLAIVRKGVERMGGAAGVESAPGRGSRFWIDLPAAGADGALAGGDPAGEGARP